MVQETAQNQRIILAEARLGALFGHSYGWVQKLEREGVIMRANASGERALFDLEEVAPLILEYLVGAGRRQYEKARITEVREKIKKLKLENAKRSGLLISKEEARKEFGPAFIALRQACERLLRLGESETVVSEMLTKLNGNSI